MVKILAWLVFLGLPALFLYISWQLYRENREDPFVEDYDDWDRDE